MKLNKMAMNKMAMMALLVAGTAATALAQTGPGQPGPVIPLAPTGPAGNPNRPGGMFTPPGGGRMPFAAGTVTAMDATAGTVTITPQFGGQASEVIKVPDATPIMAQIEVQVTDLKVGDQVQVRGLPITIEANQIMASDSNSPAPGGGPMPFPGGARPGPGMGGPQPQGFAQVTGHVFNTNPLTISISDNVFVGVRLGQNAKISRMVTETLKDIKVGDRISAGGQTGDDGTFTASRISVNLDNGMMGGRGGIRPNFPPKPLTPQTPQLPPTPTTNP